MKILVVYQHYYPEPFRLPDICETLVQRGHSVTVITGTPNYPEGEIYAGYEKGKRADEVINGVRVHRCPLIPRKTGVLFRFLNYYSFAWASTWYAHNLKEDFDVVFAHQTSPVMMSQAAIHWAKRNGKKCVLYCLDQWPESLLAGGIKKGSLIYKIYLQVSRKIYGRADELLVSSRGFISYFDKVLKLGNKPIRHLPQYAEAMFDGIAENTEEKHCVDFMFAGNVGVLQSVETIVEAARLLEDESKIRFHIVGSGIALDACKKLAEGLTNITFHGRHDVSEMPRFYAMADAMLITMKDDPVLSATLPGKVQTYMAAGKPVVGAIGGETAWLVNEEALCGLCGPAENAEELAKNIRQIASDDVWRAHCGENARRYYHEHFEKEQFFDVLETTLRRNCI
ncbi:MAG: glycosyltransferase family 4 protein [Oscillospiraceae bacterium]|nr:glycosyltransferase family 4 protein [Oscillospiraceae bacterium]